MKQSRRWEIAKAICSGLTMGFLAFIGGHFLVIGELVWAFACYAPLAVFAAADRLLLYDQDRLLEEYMADTEYILENFDGYEEKS